VEQQPVKALFSDAFDLLMDNLSNVRKFEENKALRLDIAFFVFQENVALVIMACV
jgi:hypothetical protein